jgi:hypothetical protein
MNRIYNPLVAQERIDSIQVDGQDNDVFEDNNLGYGTVCCSPLYSKATFVGCALAIFQQLTGINFIMFYSNTLFSNLGGETVTGLVGIVNFLTTFGGLYLLSVAGRKSIMFTMSAAMAVLLILLGYFSLQEQNTPAIVCSMGFIAAFEFSSGPITWLYMAEIMQDKAVSIATVLNWVVNLVISLITPSLVNKIGEENVGYIFIVCGGLTVMGTLFIWGFMQETRGKTQAQIDDMFAKKTSDKQLMKKLTESGSAF